MSIVWDHRGERDVLRKEKHVVGSSSKVDLVFEGGGVKGIGLIGALSVLEEQGYEPQNVAGASAGAIVATLLAAGYSADELRDVIQNLDFEKFKDTDWVDRIPIAGSAISILRDQGIYEGSYFQQLMSDLLEDKGVSTFADLVHPDFADGDLRYRYKAQVIASDVTERRLLVLPRDAGLLGIDDPDNLNVAYAVRMSMSIPIFFEPVRHSNPVTGNEHIIVDGGMLSNYPVWLFDSGEDEMPEWPTFGMLLVSENTREPINTNVPDMETGGGGLRTVVEYLKSLIGTMMEAHDRLYVEKAEFARTIPIPTVGVGTTKFDLTDDDKDRLYESGRTAAEEFLATWDFDGYVARFRQGAEYSRRKDVAEEIAATDQ